MKVRPKVKRIVGLTGTPSSNGLMDLFAEYKLLDMGRRLGRFIGQYRSRYFVPDKTNGHVVYSYKLLPGAEEAIYDRISDITISMKSADHLKMPELVNSRYMVRLDEPELVKYERMKRDLLLQLPEGEVTAANAAALSGKLSQMANGAVYSDDGAYETIHDRKLDALEDIIEAANGKPVLTAYWYQHDLERIQERLSELKIGCARLDQERNIRRWNEGEVPVGLLHPASAGHGLNLQSGGNILVWFGLTWSLELYQQTVARLWRQGQKETVSVIHILAAKTIDEQIMRALETKDHTQRALIDAVRAEVMARGSIVNKQTGDPYENLANAVIAQAAEDYRAALKKIKAHPKNRDVINEALRIERFFSFRLVSDTDFRGWRVFDPQASGGDKIIIVNQGRQSEGNDLQISIGGGL